VKKKKEKEALRVEREKEVEDKRKQEEGTKTTAGSYKARAVVTGPVQVG
jgi:translation initiation factor IF-2